LRRDLRDVTREIRPDWDLATRGFRAAWDAGDHSLFHPYQAGDQANPEAPAPRAAAQGA
jgi:hypothetical protein